MLHRLMISNYALINHLDITFDAGLNILTGETGAGKSIILDAFALLLGQRVDQQSHHFFDQKRKCVIEGTFFLGSLDLKTFFEKNNLDYDDETVLRRELAIDGRSRAFVNDAPVLLGTLKYLGGQLIHIHTQYATTEINDHDFQLLLIDIIAGHESLLEKYRTEFQNYREAHGRLQQLMEHNQQTKTAMDYHQFQLDEITQLSLQQDEQNIIESELLALSNAQEIKHSLSEARYLLSESNIAVLLQLKEISKKIAAVEKFHPQITALYKRLASVVIELKDIDLEIGHIEQYTQVNEEKAAALSQRLSLIYNLQKKHRVNSVAALLSIQEKIAQKLNNLVVEEQSIETLKQQTLLQQQQIFQLAMALSENRRKIIPSIEAYIQHMLVDLGIPHAQIKIDCTQLNLPEKNGINRVHFLFSANKGQKLGSVDKLASGGELSRLMLSIKSLMASKAALPSIIFDEVDIGISGKIANKVGQAIEKLAKNLQVIVITHLPQIACKGNTHFVVYKEETQEHIPRTCIRQLNANERVQEIANMLSGKWTSKSALEYARELLTNE